MLPACLPEAPPPPDNVIGPGGAAPEKAAEKARPAPKAAPAPAAQPPLPPGPLRVGLTQAILLALENNQSLRVDRLNPAIRRTFEEEERSAFDPTASAEVSAGRTKARIVPEPAAGPHHSAANSANVSGGLQQFLPTGTTLEAEASSDVMDPNLRPRDASSRLGLSVTQALLRGYGVPVNLARLRQARLDTAVSEYELRGFAQDLVANVEQTFWNYALAQRQIEIVSESLKLAEQQKAETGERIKIGKLAETELAAALAEIALRQEALINARSALARTRLSLLRLLNPQGAGLWGRELELQDQPRAADVKLDDVETHVQLALRMRPDLNEARLQVLRGDLELVRTKNGLLPRLDLFIALGKSGYAASFGGSLSDLGGSSYDAAAGLRFEYPLGNRAARARHERATLSRRQLAEALENLTQLAQMDVRTAYIEVGRTREQVAATAATRKLQEEVLRTESEKLRVGKSTSLLVAQAQRDLLASQIAEVQAVVALLRSVVELYRLEGSLLDRRGLAAPGRRPVDLALPKDWGVAR